MSKEIHFSGPGANEATAKVVVTQTIVQAIGLICMAATVCCIISVVHKK